LTYLDTRVRKVITATPSTFLDGAPAVQFKGSSGVAHRVELDAGSLHGTAGIELTGSFYPGRVQLMNDTEARLVHVTVLDGKTVKTTWAKTRREATALAEQFRHDGADLSRVFSNGGIEKYRVVGWFK
jgi:hypothetical protein